MSDSKKEMSPLEFNRRRTIEGVEVMLPKCPAKKDILNFKMSVENQKWHPPKTPEGFDEWDEEDQLPFMRQEFKRRKEGVFFFNNGNIEYMTGIHYFYCTYWKIDIGLPDWRDADRDFFYLWDHVVDNEDCYGLIYITGRRQGKTSSSTAILYEATSMKENAISGMQSKTNVDAKKIFKKLISSWKKLPYWLKPTDTGESNPNSSLRFEEPGTRSSKGEKKSYKKVLNSYIDYAPATEEAYDGTKQYRLLFDEIGKKSDSDPHERYYICKPCFELGSRIVGKCIATTTVEEIDKDGGGALKSLWDESDQSRLPEFEDNRTVTGMYRYFKPAYYGLEGFIDQYGYSIMETPKKPVKGIDGRMIKMGAKEFLKIKRKKLSGKLLIQEMRKFPFDIREAFMIDSADSPFDTAKIYSQKEYNDSMIKEIATRGNFSWKGGERDTEVVWNPTPQGRWLVSYHPPIEDRNKFRNFSGQRKPLNNNICSGTDPFDHKTTTSTKKSDAASYNFLKYDPMLDRKSHCFISEYVNRPNTPEMFYEDMVMQSVYFGSTMLVENNKIGIVNYFRQRGYYDYLMPRPESTHTKYSQKNQIERGIPLSGDAAREVLIERLESYIYEYIGLNDETGKIGECPFDALLNDWLNFSTEKWTDYDSTVASGLTILASKKKTYVQDTSFDLRELFPKYDNSGSISRLIK